MFWLGVGVGIVVSIVGLIILAAIVGQFISDSEAEEGIDKELNSICWSCTHYDKSSTEEPCISCTDGFSKWQRKDNIGELVGQDRD
jgi:hypothetical protein